MSKWPLILPSLFQVWWSSLENLERSLKFWYPTHGSLLLVHIARSLATPCKIVSIFLLPTSKRLLNGLVKRMLMVGLIFLLLEKMNQTPVRTRLQDQSNLAVKVFVLRRPPLQIHKLLQLNLQLILSRPPPLALPFILLYP
ncbi:unnamed protein product [Brassica oleracea var. botrytis]|uniref:Uncharacterized protein n=1 Tax=Brassica oleracea TaxID=3712 RepID=A0A3P6BVA7_BRAOL|nr:unnamed protein product [Brassica oleracea]